MKYAIFLITTAGFASAASAGVLETARSAQLSPIDTAGILTQTLRAPDPKPQHLAMDSWQLLELLDDKDPVIRKAAVKSSKNFISMSSIRERVAEILKSRAERADIRIEAARALSYGAGYQNASEALLEVLRRGGEQGELRVISCKALWNSAGLNGARVEDFLIEAVEDGNVPQERLAAVWALFGRVNVLRTREFLAELVKESPDEALRIEAIKSLYGAMGYMSINEMMLKLAADKKETKAVRLAAIKTLSGASGSSNARRFLDDMIRNGTDPELRAAALAACSPDIAELNMYFHLPYATGNGTFNPIEL